MAADERDEILGQVYFALGSGAGAMRIERKAIAGIRAVLWDRMKDWPARWEANAHQVLERARAMGRLAAHTATERGDTEIRHNDLRDAAEKVAIVSFTDVCGVLKDVLPPRD